MRLLVGIATTGRAEILSETLTELGKQIRLPDRVVICAAKAEDIERRVFSLVPYPVDVVGSTPGASSQRNAILRVSDGFDAVVFFDDDFLPSQSYLANAEALLAREPEVVIACGVIMEDGALGPGLEVDYARRRLALVAPPGPETGPLQPRYGVYGCNMVVRLEPVQRHRLSFDEALPLYSWMEDRDFSRQLAPFGRIVGSPSLTGIHLGVRRARISGVKFGYSQIANPIYLIRKGTVSDREGLRIVVPLMVRPLIANMARSFTPEPYIDRLGRLKGNMLAIRDLLRGRLHPCRILELD
jgi:hypothetical protein